MTRRRVRALCALVGALLALGAVVTWRTARFVSLQTRLEEEPPDLAVVDVEAAARRLGEAVTFRTLSSRDGLAPAAAAAFEALHEHLAASYPAVHRRLGLEKVGGLSLLYTWEGSDRARAPVILMAHQDIVPAAADDWEHAPFAGDLARGYVWGRGTLDNKVMVLALLEAVETLLAEGFEPARTIYLAFGHDEEVGGEAGARAVARRLAERGVERAAFVLDEGAPIVAGLVPGIAGPVALIGIAEKGSLSLELRVEAEGGHSSMPPASTSIGVLARAVRRLEDSPFPLRLTPAVAHQFRFLGPEMPFASRVALANLWLFEPLFLRALASSSATAAALLRTTTAATLFHAGVQANVLPVEATAVVNFRILSGETTESVRRRAVATIADARVEVTALPGAADPSPVADSASPAFRLLERTIRQTWGDAPELIVAPCLLVGGTDSRHFSALSASIFRFTPLRVDSAADLRRWHGKNERVGLGAYARSIAFFRRLIRKAASP